MQIQKNMNSNMEIQRFYNAKFIKNNKIIYKQYQVNIVNQIYKSNSLVVLPTALGKTIIGIILAAKYLEEFKDSKILVLAPTKPLVYQHFKTFQDLMDDYLKFDVLIGNKTPLKRALSIINNDILFSTPQIIKNDLTLGSYNLKDFSLIIFDEAHHARKNYAYTFIANEYINTAKVPYILGLTASPGKDKNVINDLIEKLKIERVCFKHENDDDVSEYIYGIDLYIENIFLQDGIYYIQDLLKDKIKEIVNFFIGKNILPVKNYYSKVDFIRLNQDIHCYDLYGPDYEYFNFPNIIPILAQDTAEISTYISLCISGIYLLHMEEILTCQTPEMFVNYIEKLQKRAQDGSYPARRILNSKVFKEKILPFIDKLRTLKSPKINVIKNLLQNQFSLKPSSKVIIFTQFRDIGIILKEELIKLNDNCIKCERFIGQAYKENDEGLTQKLQQEIINLFRNKQINVLIATSIAEEGLDIPEVDLVIFYEPVPSEIRLIQRRGRTGRHMKGNCIILCAKNTLDEIYLDVSFKKEKNMKNTLVSVDDLELFTEIKRCNSEFEPEKINEKQIYEFFKNYEERKKLSMKKSIDAIDSIKNSELEKSRVQYLCKLGINDITAEMLDFSLKKIQQIEENKEKLKKLKKEEYIQRKIEKIIEKYNKNHLNN